MFFADRVPPEARNAYRMDAAAGMLGAVMLGLTAPFISVIARGTLKASAFEISILSVAPFAGYLLSLLWASMMEGKRKMPFAVGSWIVARSLFLLAFVATTHWAFVAMMALYYVLGSVSGPAYSAIMKEVYPDGDRARIMGYARVCTLVVVLVVSCFAGPLLRGHNYRFVFPLAALFGLAGAMAFNRIPARQTHGDPSVPLRAFARSAAMILREDCGFRRFTAGIFVCGFANLMLSPLYAIYQVDVLGVNTDWAAAFSVVGCLVSMFGFIYWGAYIDRRTSNEALVPCTILLALIPLAYCVITRAWMLLPVVVLGSVINSGMELAYANGLLQYAPAQRITHYQGLFYSLAGVRGLVAPFVGVALVQSLGVPVKSMFLFAFGIMLLGAAIQAAEVIASRGRRSASGNKSAGGKT